jgi:autotransporter-associated beta strand protein
MQKVNKSNSTRRSENVRKAMIVAGFGVVTLGSALAQAQTTYTFGAGSSNFTGSWTTAGNWSPAAVPNTLDTVNVASNNTLQINTGDSVNALKVNIGSASGGATLSLSGSLTVAAQTLGTVYTTPSFVIGLNTSNVGTGVINAGANLTITDLNIAGGAATLGNGAASFGSLTVNGTLLYNTSNSLTGSGRGFVIGRSGTGILTVNNGASVDLRSLNSGINNTDMQLEMGYNQGGVGILNVTGGTFQANFVNVRNNTVTSAPNAQVTLNFSGGTSTFAGSDTTNGIIKTNPGLVTLNISGGQLNLRTPLRAAATPLAGGSVTWSGGTIRMYQSSGTITMVDNFNLVSGGTGATFDTNGTTNILSGTINGAGSFTKDGAGQLTLSGTQQYTGGLTLRNGTLILSNPSNTLTGGVRLNAGLLQIGGSGTPLGPTSNTLFLAGGTLSSTGTGGVGVNTSVSVTGNVAIGNSTLTGRVQFGSPIDLTGGTRTFTGTGAGTNGRVIDFNSGTISNGTLALASSTGNERFRIGGVTVTGGVRVDSGVLFLGTSGAIGFNGIVTVNSPGTLDMSDAGAVRSPNFASLNGSGNVVNTNAPNSNLITAILNVGGASQTGSFSGVLADKQSVGAYIGINVLNGATQTLTNPANAFVGPVIVSTNSTLRTPSLANAGLPSAIGAASSANSLLLSGGTLQYYGDAVSTNRSFALTSAGGAIDASGSTNAGDGALKFTSTAALSFDETYAHTFTWAANTNSYGLQETYGIAPGQLITGPGITPGTTVLSTTNGTITLSGNVTAASTNGTFTFVNPSTNDRTFTLTGVNTAANTFSPQLTDTPYGRVALTKSGVGTWVLTNTETYTGPTLINAGKLTLAAGASLGATNVTVSAGATFDPSAAYPAGYPVAAGLTLTYNGTVVGGVVNNGLVANTSTTDLSIASSFSGSGSFSKSGNATVTFTGAASFPAGFTVSGGAVVMGASSSLSSNAVSVFSNGTLDVSALVGGLQVAGGNTAIMNGVITGSIVNNGFVDVTTNANRTYPATISGSGSLRKYDGSGVATFSSTVNLAGGINVSNGTAVFTRPLGPVTGTLVVTGPGAITLDPTSYATNSFTSPGSVASISLGSSGQTGVSVLSVTATNRAAARSSVLVTSGLAIANADSTSTYSGFLDVGNNDLIIKGGAANLAALQGYVRAWLATGNTGLGSSVATPASGSYTTLALFVNDAGNGTPYYTQYDGIGGLAAGDVIAKYTYVGDTNLDGVLDGKDYKTILETVVLGGDAVAAGRTTWNYGDVNADGVVNTADLASFAAAYANYTTNNPGSLGGATDDGGGVAAIPEPSTCGVVLAAGALGLTRRRRRAVSTGL